MSAAWRGGPVDRATVGSLLGDPAMVSQRACRVQREVPRDSFRPSTQNAPVKHIDVAVVGGGPAGATAARLLAERGARVVLLEARRIPRPKLCGGGLTPKAMPYVGPAARSTIV